MLDHKLGTDMVSHRYEPFYEWSYDVVLQTLDHKFLALRHNAHARRNADDNENRQEQEQNILPAKLHQKLIHQNCLSRNILPIN